MKLMIALTAMIAIACGRESDQSNTKASLHPDTFKSQFVSLQPVEGHLISAAHGLGGTQSGHPFSFTDVTLGFSISCVNELAPLSYHVEYETRSSKEVAKIYVSAFQKVHKDAPLVFCSQGTPTMQTLRINGQFDKDAIEIVWNQGDLQALPKDMTNIRWTDAISVKAVYPLCPPNALCITDGTVIELEVDTGACLDESVLSFSTHKNGSVLDIHAGALTIGREASERADCAENKKDIYRISLNMQFFQPENINLLGQLPQVERVN